MATDELDAPVSVAVEGVIVLDELYSVIGFDSGGGTILSHLNAHGGAAEELLRLPAEVLRFLKDRSDHDPDQIMSEPVRIGPHEYGCRILLIKAQCPGVASPMFAVYLKRELSVLDAVAQAGTEYRLTDREQEALVGITMGLTSKELAERMDISPNTVKTFLRLIMIKMGVTTRAAIVGKLLDQGSRAKSRPAAKPFMQVTARTTNGGNPLGK